jgi:endoglucanase Acf2
VVLGHYFDPLAGVKALAADGSDLSSLIEVYGSVNYGKAGTYLLKYKANETLVERTVTVAAGTYSHPTRNRNDGADRSVSLGSGSYRTGAVALPSETKDGTKSDYNNLFRRAGSADFIDNEAFNAGAIPTNTWWSGFEHSNYGGPTLAALNPLCAGYTSDGMYISYKGTGFTQYFSVKDTFGVTRPTMSNFAPVFKDVTIKPASLASTNYSKVLSYSENAVNVAMRNTSDGEDEMVSHFVQGSPYVVSEFKDPSDVVINLRIAAVTNAYEFYDLSGKQITESSYTGSDLVVRMPGAQTGYVTTYPETGVGAPTYGEEDYLLSAPEGTIFTFSQGKHASPLFKEQINLAMNGGNYLSVCTLNSKDEASFYAASARAMALKNTSSYSVDSATSTTQTTFSENIQYLDGKESTPLSILMPHQWKNSSDAVTSYQIKTTRGTNKIRSGKSFSVNNSFYGLLPSFTLPSDSTFSSSTLETYISKVLADTVPGEVSLYWADSDKNFINSPGPYWCGKAIYPLCQAIIAADQASLSTDKSLLVARLKSLLVDWLTYSGTGDKRWLYYDQIYGSMYYSSDNFSTNSRLSDHHFTSGYLVYGCAVLAMFDGTFASEYGEMAKLLAKDYMNYDGDSLYPSFRTFDSYNGHSWADGFGDFGDDNDQESSGEALNSWSGAYLLGVALGDQAMENAAIWGFSNEMEAVKQYWFNYDENNWIASLANYTHVLGIVWGTKNDYATWFGSNPEFIYGIHWLPTGEYLSNYALGSGEKTMLKKIYAELLGKVGGTPRTWFSNFWAIQALCDNAAALSAFDGSKILADDYPDEVVGSYWMLHALATYGDKETTGVLQLNSAVAGSVYVSNGTRKALLWNPSNKEETVTFSANGSSKSVVAAPRTFSTVHFIKTYRPHRRFSMENV